MRNLATGLEVLPRAALVSACRANEKGSAYAAALSKIKSSSAFRLVEGALLAGVAARLLDGVGRGRLLGVLGGLLGGFRRLAGGLGCLRAAAAARLGRLDSALGAVATQPRSASCRCRAWPPGLALGLVSLDREAVVILAGFSAFSGFSVFAAFSTFSTFSTFSGFSTGVRGLHAHGRRLRVAHRFRRRRQIADDAARRRIALVGRSSPAAAVAAHRCRRRERRRRRRPTGSVKRSQVTVTFMPTGTRG